MQGTDRIKSLDWQEIADRMKNDLNNPPNKIEGSFASDNIQAVAKELAKYYDYIDWLVDMHFADTATGEFLDAKAKEVGVFRKKEVGPDGQIIYEDDESLRERTLLKMRYPGTSGNIFHYMQWAREVDGVGRVKVFPLWKGPGTVKVSILDSKQRPAGADLIEKVKLHIDQGGERKGEGLAPIGAYLSVSTAKVKKLDIRAKLDLDGLGKEEVAEKIKESLRSYIDREISYIKTRLTVAKVIDLCYSIDGVVDIGEITVNGATDSIELSPEEVFEVGEVTIL